MSNIGPHLLTSFQAEQLLRLILSEGTFEISTHCRQRMKWRGVDSEDLIHLLMTGKVNHLAEWDSAHKNWKYRVEGTDIDGDELRAITVIFADDLLLLVVTVF